MTIEGQGTAFNATIKVEENPPKDQPEADESTTTETTTTETTTETTEKSDGDADEESE